MTSMFEEMLGPRVPAHDLRSRFSRYALPAVLLVAAGVLLSVSYVRPYWHLMLRAPQFGHPLRIEAYLSRVEGDLAEFDRVNQYIGMRPLNEAAQLERRSSGILLACIVLLLLAATVLHTRWAALAALPGLLFPIGFLLDLQFWLASFGSQLQRDAELARSVPPFVPPVLGTGQVGEFSSEAAVGSGFWLAAVASIVILVALFCHRRAYKPLVEVPHRNANDFD